MVGFREQVRFLKIKQIEAYWEGLRMGRLVPLRSEIDPRGIERALEYTFILERIAPGLGRFRLSGMHLNDLLGMEVRGMPFTSFFTPAARNTVTDALELVFDGPQVAELTLTAEKGIGRPAMDAKVILLPLRSDLGEVTRVLGALVTDGPIGRAPRRFNVANVQMKVLERGHAPATVAELAPVKTPVKGFAEGQAPYTPPTEKGPDDNHPTLRLVVSND
ncbi:PAS domain-containing protein [Profundibacter amoris]|uniref:PAS domain-containing protein n=2 Tax=Profundibacter amoris TaxID=2171755 RepID=A0A347ULL3_9RHOB|nr:PAS domain-containing protein [Profundibacter amoris]